MLQAWAELFFPPQCAACARVGVSAGGVFCSSCEPQLEPLYPPFCDVCGEPQPHVGKCARCRALPPAFDQAYAPFTHFGPLSRAIHRWKYEDHPELTRPLGQLLAAAATDFLEEAPAALVPIPLHARRFQKRRYDQAHLLAEALGTELRRPVVALLERVKETRRQVGLSEAEREENVAGAFRATRRCDGLKLLMVDDVLTTGATARAAARALRDAGAEQVWLVTLARAHQS